MSIDVHVFLITLRINNEGSALVSGAGYYFALVWPFKFSRKFLLRCSMAESCGCDAGSKDACEIAPKTIDRDGHEFPFSDVADCEVFDEQGKAHRFGSFYEGSKAIVVFVRVSSTA